MKMQASACLSSSFYYHPLLTLFPRLIFFFFSQTHILRLIKEVGYELSFLLLRRQSPTEKCLTPGLRPEKVQDKYFLVPDNKGGA